jgi:Histidine kinase-, DNA gyrase B-, and HSP90-like ATPase
MWTMEETAQFAQTTMRRSRGTAVLLAVGAVVLLGLAVGRARRARPARDRDARPGGRPVPLAEVAAAAVHASPDPSRVDLAVAGDLLVPWRAADDLADLLAELVDNAVAFSAPETRVRVGGRRAGPGYVVEVEDRGLGMTDAELAAVNRRLAGDPAAGDDPGHRLGAWMVGRLAIRHDVTVRLRRSPRGGVTALVLLPERLVVASLPLRRSAAPAPEVDPPLPRRSPHTSLAPDLAAGHPGHQAAPRPARSPEQVRAMLTRYRSGLERGRVAAARDLPDDPLP